MRKQNNKIKRVKPNKNKIVEQLEIILYTEGISAVCILTGEYAELVVRKNNIQLIIWTIEKAFSMGFNKVFFNIGSLYDEEIQIFSERFGNEERLVLSLFQETYDKKCYERYFGKYNIHNPKSDFKRRLSTPERFINAGFKQVDIGILVGLNDIDFEIDRLISHINLLKDKTEVIYVSLPRTCGVDNVEKSVSDKKYKEIIKLLFNTHSKIKLIITTREEIKMIKELLPYIHVISPGCSDVLPYTNSGKITNSIDTSQFQVKPLRDRPSEILNALPIKNDILYYDV